MKASDILPVSRTDTHDFINEVYKQEGQKRRTEARKRWLREALRFALLFAMGMATPLLLGWVVAVMK